MAYLKDIIHNIEQTYSVKVYGLTHDNQTIDGIRFLDKNDIQLSYLYSNILYITDYSKLYSPDLVGHILCIGCADKLKILNHMYIEETLNLHELHNTIENTLHQHRQIESIKNSIFNSLYTGRGIDGLLETAYKAIGNPITICDSSYNIIEVFPKGADEKYFQLRNKRYSLKEIFTNNMKSTQTIQRIYHSVYPFAITLDDSEVELIFISIRIKRAVVGYVCVKCVNKSYEEKDLEIIHSLSQMLSIQLQKDDSYKNPYGIKYDMFLKQLFENQFDDKETAIKHLTLMGVEPKKYYYIIVSTFTHHSYAIMAKTYYWEQLSTIFPNSVTGIFGNRFITLISTPDKESFFERIYSRFEAFLQMNQMLSALSYGFTNLTDANLYSNQSNSLLTDRLVAYNETPIALYEDYYLKDIISLTKQPAHVKSTIHPSIKDMYECDQTEGTDYIKTLSAYFECNRNMPATAKKLFIHKSTLFYRFDKMKQLFNVDTNNPDKLFAYEYSLRILKILE